ncbi:MAG TPA: 2-dehydro-3-deoxygalactonokinase [Verrucomicrobiae bacterium]|nr:2-dehydro-3-deoxygalactonokinase [Verrucomicrobiae bacterium]
MVREFLSCDWGTSSFRIQWVADTKVTEPGGSQSGDKRFQVLRAYRDNTGSRSLFEKALELGDNSQEGRARIYADFLSGVLQQWKAARQNLQRSIPLVISGMASSSIGWQEVPYATAPLKLDGSNLQFAEVALQELNWIKRVYLISGVATENEMMRGEETEAIGLLQDVPCRSPFALILPGTHSKHLLVHDGEVTDFWTYMTGEIFDVLARYSVLKATVDLSSLATPNQTNLASFDAGVRQADRSGLAASLFQTRARAVLKGMPTLENTWFLSGLLIGAELADARSRFSGLTVLLGGASEMRSLYARALTILENGSFTAQELMGEFVESAVIRAHSLFLEQRNTWKE